MSKIQKLFGNLQNKECRKNEDMIQEIEKMTKPFISPGRPKLKLNFDDNTLQFMYEQGESISFLARLCHCSETTIRRHLKLDKRKSSFSYLMTIFIQFILSIF